MRRRNWVAAIVLLAIFAVLAWRVGTGPFVAGIGHLTPAAVLLACALTAVATVVAAWRWKVVAQALGSRIPLRKAVSAYYRSQFVNSVLPGGVLGDVERGITTDDGTHGRARRLGIVAWDRVIGQAVQLVALLVAVTVAAPLVAASIVAVLAIVTVALTRIRRAFFVRIRADAVLLFGRPAVVVRVVAASVIVVLLHATVFVVAALVTGSASDPLRMLPIALAVEVAMAIPLNVAGWGPREGAAAAIFGAVGLGAAAGVAASVAYGVLALVAVRPGGVVLVAARWRLRRAAPVEVHA